jgi:hypothetical protein
MTITYAPPSPSPGPDVSSPATPSPSVSVSVSPTTLPTTGPSSNHGGHILIIALAVLAVGVAILAFARRLRSE